MAYKTFALDDQTQVTIYKRKGASSIRLSVTSTGTVRVTVPSWTPYAAGLTFARTKLDWIKQQARPAAALHDGQRIGKAHELQVAASDAAKKVTSRVINNTVVVRHPANLTEADAAVQKVIASASMRALRKEAEQLLPKRTAELAERYEFHYTSVSVKQLKSRWGSCDQHQHLVFNLFLMQLPWELIDYVIMHELTHTQHMNHGPEFWKTIERFMPNAKARRKAMRQYQPLLQA